MSLIDRIRRAREVGVEAGGRKFTIRRPTDEEAVVMSRRGDSLIDIVKRFTCAWDLVELDLIPGGGPEPVPFDSVVWSEWVADHPEIWGPLGEAILEQYRLHAAKRDAAAKN